MEKKFVCFDIDGTLLDENKMILTSTKEAIHKLQNEGHTIAIATGRNAYMIQDILAEVNVDNYIVCNGAAGYLGNKLSYFDGLDKEGFADLLKETDKNNHSVIYQTAFELRRRTENINMNMVNAMQSVDFSVPEQDFNFNQKNDLTQALIFYSEEEKDHYEKGQFPQFRFVRWHESGVDILPINGSKFNTINALAIKLGFSMSNVIAFGDGMNDIEMISDVGTGVAMGNAVDEVKQKADYITESHNNHGIALALKHLKLI
ncbi:Cof-type HAD-IIB family hydrolase [Lacticigenium naphthae]|uniref:Cof-type HAD-IIB family hydrolase n=1 Tax=Lacticigenium naphthae TaxID=515351 RepID=UPI0004160F68|nr:Cof-type HAD-IIB family hydrolase [Lacticigenium naphthae]